MKPFEILICGRFDPDALQFLKSQPNFNIKQTSDQPSPKELDGCDGLLVRSTTVVNQSLLKQASQLKVIITSTVGYDHFHLEAINSHNITAMFCPHSNTQSAAELTIALMLTSHRKLNQAQVNVVKGLWRTENLRGKELKNKTLGIIGFGRVGKKVARLAQAFEMQVMACDPYLENIEFYERNVQRMGLDELLKVSDVISLHVPLTAETENLLHRIYLENLQPGSLLINTSRGKILKESELLWALEESDLAALALDVFEKEPIAPTSWLKTDPRVTLTPHIGATTFEALRESSFEAARKLIDFLVLKQAKDVLPEETLWAKGIFLGPKSSI